MSNTSNLALPFLAVGQAQKHVTVNESLRKLDALVQLVVVSATTTAQPASPGDGEVYIVPSGKSGADWSAFANWSLGYYRDGAWVQITPREGWLAYVKDSDQLQVYTGSAWSVSSLRSALGLTALATTTPATGIATFLATPTSANLAAAVTDETGSGALVFATAPTLANPTLSGTVAGTVAASGAWTFDTGGKLAVSGPNGSNAFMKFQNASTDKWAVGRGAGDNSDDYDIYNFNTSSIALAISTTTNAATLASSLTVGGPVAPATDNAADVGSASFRWRTVYAATGAINTSDAREKTGLRALSDAERRAIRRVMAGVGVFQWLEAIGRKGDNPDKGGARLHVGVTAQDVAAAFEAEGLDAARYGLFCADPVVERYQAQPQRIAPATDDTPERIIPAVIGERPVRDDTGEPVIRLGVRYDQLFAMALAVLLTPESWRG